MTFHANRLRLLILSQAAVKIPRRCAATATPSQRLSAFRSKEVVEAYVKLGLSPDDEVGPIEVREAFFLLAKRFHPDAGSPEADGGKFAAVKDAYQIVMESGTVEGVGTPNARPEREDFSTADAVMEELARKFDIRHTVPQHRQYLSFDGFGRGSPMQRSRQYDKHRAETAAAKAVEYRVEKIAWKDEKTAVVVDKKRTKDVKTRVGMERMVEDLIQESMQKGEFDVIKGKGKPLKPGTENPYTDFMTRKMNEIMINNGYQPEWVELGKEIREHSQEAKDRLLFARCSLGQIPFDKEAEQHWQLHVNCFEQEWKAVGEKIKKFNLLVPTLNQQIIQASVEKEIKKILLESEPILRTADGNSKARDASDQAYRHFGLPLSNSNYPDSLHGRPYDPAFSDGSSLGVKYDSPMELFLQLVKSIFRWKRRT